jgi:hypothetical protein
MLVWCGGVLLAAGMGPGIAQADVPRAIHYQGKLTEPDGTPLVGEHAVTIRLYGAASGGEELWQERHTISLIRSDSGVFSVILGSQAPFGSSITFNDPLWITIEVDGGGEFAPRQPLSSVSYAINADTLDGLNSTQFLRSLPDHSHEGLHSLAASGQPPLLGDAILAAGPNVSLTQSGQTITIGASGSTAESTPGGKVSESASSAVAIGTSDTDLISATITKTQAGSSLLVLANVQVSHLSPPNNKTVDLFLVRDGSSIGGTYTVRFGKVNEGVSSLPVSLHALDAAAAGSHTVTLRAKASGGGAEATVRRLTVIEIF